MVLEFTINPHTRNIIVGRKSGRGESNSLVCSAKNCGQPIEVTGTIKCTRCPDTIINFPNNLDETKTFLICPACHIHIALKDDKGNYVIIWTQEVVSKHRKNKHTYYHKGCWEGMHIGSDEDEV